MKRVVITLISLIGPFIAFAQKAALLCGHNIHFDTGIIKANILRELGHEYYDSENVEDALYKGKRIDTMRSTMKWVDARNNWGKPKFPNLSELYSRCFPGETFPAHDAKEDVKAVARCLPVLLENGLVELKIKEYPTESPEKPVNGPISHDNPENDKSLIRTEKTPQIENSAKITDIAKELLNETEF